MKKFNEWNEVKKEIDLCEKSIIFKERDIFWVSIGENIGYEQNGKGEIFSRPVVIVKRFSRNMFFGIPLSTQLKEGNFFFEFELSGVKSNALVVQGRLFDAKRLENKIGMMNKNDFDKLRVRVRELLNV
jgi:mRNA interferase MazF